MSSKSDRDNRSNQLNPNNSAYDNSRGHGQSDDDDDGMVVRRLTGAEALERALARMSQEIREKERNRPVETLFRAAFVALIGPVKVIEFSVASTSFFGGKAGNEDLAEILVEEIGRQLRIRWKSGLALQA